MIPAAVGIVLAIIFQSSRVLLYAVLIDVTIMVVVYLWLKRATRGLNVDAQQVQKHIDYYNAQGDDAFKIKRLKEYKEVALNYYTFASQLFHRIWGPHYSMAIVRILRESFCLSLFEEKKNNRYFRPRTGGSPIRKLNQSINAISRTRFACARTGAMLTLAVGSVGRPE